MNDFLTCQWSLGLLGTGGTNLDPMACLLAFWEELEHWEERFYLAKTRWAAILDRWVHLYFQIDSNAISSEATETCPMVGGT